MVHVFVAYINCIKNCYDVGGTVMVLMHDGVAYGEAGNAVTLLLWRCVVCCVMVIDTSTAML